MSLYHIKDKVLVSRNQLVDRTTLPLEERIKHRAGSNDIRNIDSLAKNRSKYLGGRIRADSDKVKKKKGFGRFDRFRSQAGKGEYRCLYVWADTACIDKRSSTDPDEAIRSVYNWYRNA
ncbi:hypothetical protein BDN71DRAFT_1506597 [Pleurotus eryngii]|uniref:Heterokaryon incompatibility domain-containing protein n=1 Tax=Pleurotus eryngii TaxID=5323 RepID=A0A9P5ZY77_PLEER|nr:hypothetical protein BDN71DRAFT_1506597 [Pleurotus eryngii]